MVGGYVSSISHHDGRVYVTAIEMPFAALNAANGSIVCTLGVVDGSVSSHSALYIPVCANSIHVA